MSQLYAKNLLGRLLVVAMTGLTTLLAGTAQAAAPGITGPTFYLTAQTANLNQPDGAAVYAWGYGCDTAHTPSGFNPPVSLMPGANCPTMQVPGPTLIVTEGQTVTVNLTNNLPTAAGNTSILFPGFQAASTGGVAGLLTQEAAPGGTVSYTFTATSPGTHAYYSGTQGDLQIEMGLYGAIIVLPATVPTACTTGYAAKNLSAEAAHHESDFRLSKSAYDHPKTCYDREYLFQFAEMDPNIHNQALAQVTALAGCIAGAPACSLEVPTEPYHPAYFLINGRSMPDDMDANYAIEYPHQPYNGNPHMHPGEQTLIRVIGQGRWQHPFHEHANHVRILGRDGNLIQTPPDSTGATELAGMLMFTTDTTPGQAFDGIFYYTGRGLNWDMYGHNPVSADPLALLTCTPDANGYNTGDPTAVNYFEWCQDHNKPLQVAPFGDVASGGPATLPDPNILTNGAWYSGSPYLGPDATTRATGPTSVFQPSNIQANPSNERGYAFMWHSHNEREITTNNVFPGGMLMMMLIDSREFVIDESN
ncbi:multicopper oxidase family protein [Sideroxydans sp. CL21]|uniref:multicopper oxidase family protein n=1 Tax=Sideroxydans sp. CL21 TaxID=2600596 RepID=UPI0024BC2B50|nr:multicopper oxidase family protein [Sideroxydans sp. CL21]